MLLTSRFLHNSLMAICFLFFLQTLCPLQASDPSKPILPTGSSLQTAYGEKRTLAEELVNALLKKGAVGSNEDDPALVMPLKIISGYTVFLADCEETEQKIVTPVGCGVFGVSPDGYRYTFYTLDGDILGKDKEWQVSTNYRVPRMAPEGVIMHKAGKESVVDYDRQLYLIKPTGLVEALPKQYVDATNFVDGIAAVATKVVGLQRRWGFVNRTLRPFLPNLITEPRHFGKENFTIAPLSEGLRAVYVLPDDHSMLGHWGFINELGEMVIPPKYNEVRSFKDSVALVNEGDLVGNFYFINKSGRTIFQPLSAIGNLYDPNAVSDFDKGICTIEPMDVEDLAGGYYARYFSKSGKLLGYALWGSALHKGQGFMRYIDKNDNEEHPTNLVITEIPSQYNLNKGYRIQPDPHTAEWGMPWYDEDGVAHYTEGSVSLNNLGIGSQYAYSWKIGAFSKDGYAPAEIVSPNGELTFEGIIDDKGQFKIIYRVY